MHIPRDIVHSQFLVSLLKPLSKYDDVDEFLLHTPIPSF